MRIVFFSHYFPPEGNAPASRTMEHVQRWAHKGEQITVITCAPNVPDGKVYDGYRNRLWPQHERIGEVDVYRVWTFLAANSGGIKRILNYLSYMLSAIICFTFWCRRPDVIVATSPQFFCGWAGILSSFIKRCPIVLEIRDIWPESIVSVGAMKKGTLTRMLELLERWMYRAANRIVAVGKGYGDNIAGKIGGHEKIQVVMNGVDTGFYVPQPKNGEFLSRHGAEHKTVCAYVGTIGLAHGLEIVIEAAKLLRAQHCADFCFLLVGDGARRRELEKCVAESDLGEYVKFTGRLPKEHMPMVLASSDCLLVHLKKSELFETVIPSKIFEAMAMNRPIILGVTGESREIVLQARAGVPIQPEHADELVRALQQLRTAPPQFEDGQSPRSFVAEHYSRDTLAERFRTILHDVVQPTK